MSHVPELPERFVCVGCQAVFAGSVEDGPDGRHYFAPDRCAACGGEAFVTLENWTHESAQDSVA